MIAATHLTTVGRPVPMTPSDSFVDEFGYEASRTVLCHVLKAHRPDTHPPGS